MKNIFLTLVVFAIAFTSCKDKATKKIDQTKVAEADQKAQAAANLPVISFEKTMHDFGTVKEGDVLETVFKFTNTGKTPLTIVNATASCGCTVPEYPKNKPIAPGDSGEIKVRFNTENKPNAQTKTITISANTKSGREQIKIKAMVTPNPEKQQKREQAAAKRRADREKLSK